MKRKKYCGECEHFLHEDIYGHGYCETFNEERICGQLCKEDVSNAEELTRDLMALLASFSGKYYGRRSLERRKQNKK